MPRRREPARLQYRTAKDRWIIVDGGKEINTGCRLGEREGAETQFGDYLARHRPIDTGQRNPAQISCADVIALYIKHHAVAPAIYHGEPLLAFFGAMTLSEVNGQACREYAGHRGARVSLSTVRRELVTLQAAFNFWHQESPLDAVPKVVKPEESPARMRYLTRNEAARLIAAARRLRMSHIARFILIGLYTGTRHDAILRLRWTPSDDAGWIDVERSVLHRAGATERQTKKRRTAARIPDRLMAHARIWRRRDLETGPQAAIVRWKGKPIAKERRAWARVVKAARLGDDVTPHVLKHTAATWGLQSGMSIWDLAGLLGTSIKTIEATYGHHDPAFQSGAAGAFRRTA